MNKNSTLIEVTGERRFATGTNLRFMLRTYSYLERLSDPKGLHNGVIFVESFEIDTTWKTIIWQQFGAAIDMLGNALLACPTIYGATDHGDRNFGISSFTHSSFSIFNTSFIVSTARKLIS